MVNLETQNILHFINSYEKAYNNNQELFTFDGDLVTVEFAGYIIKQISLTFEHAVKAILN